jgi:hypothetical protein
MTIRRAALYIGGASLLVAWLSSAASLSLQTPPRQLPAPASNEPSPELIAASVQAQAKRLKERLATAPLPQEPIRNPFAFGPVNPPPPTSARRLQASVDEPPALIPPDPMLALIGIGESRNPDGIVRTAMITTDRDELVVAAVGDVVVQRYQVAAIGPDAVELSDVATGTIRRLSVPRSL